MRFTIPHTGRRPGLLLALALAGLLAACGQKGPLYLPDPDAGARQQPQ